MIDTIHFLREDLIWPIVIGLVLLWILFLWKEYKAVRNTRFIIRGIVALLALSAVASLFLEPVTFQKQVKGVAVLKTANFDSNLIDSLKSTTPALKTITYKENQNLQPQLDSISELHISGDGVAIYDLWQFKNKKVYYHPHKPTSGIIKLAYDTEVLLGDSLTVTGLYKNSFSSNTVLLQESGARTIDSVKILNQDETVFKLHTLPKAKGNYLYHIIVKDSLGKIISSDPLPLTIKDRGHLRVLMVNTFPTFETKYLKNYLAESGHEVLVRSQITKDRYKFENYNRSQKSIYNFTRQNLSEFDVIITDVSTYNGLSQRSKNAINYRVEEQGMGLLLQADALLIEQGSKFGFRFRRKNITALQLPSWPRVKIPVYPATLTKDALVEPILATKNSVLSAYAQKGTGRIGTLLAEDSFQLLLGGNEDVYHYLWSTALGKISQQPQSLVQWSLSDYMAYNDEPFEFNLRTSIALPKVVMNNDVVVPLVQNVTLQDQWSGTIYPNGDGWVNLKVAQAPASLKAMYVINDTAWRAKKVYKQISENASFYKNENSLSSESSIPVLFTKWWAFTVFILAMGYLWLAPRIYKS